MAWQDSMGNKGTDDNVKLVSEAPYHPGYEDVGFDTLEQIIGRKFDGGKLEYGLLPPLALEETVKVLTFGAQKYERDNWQKVPDAKRRYFDALQRHVWSWKQGEQIDPESGIHHLAHAMCCLMFLYEHDIMYSKAVKYSLHNGEVNEAIK
jgi:hypothetical protein